MTVKATSLESKGSIDIDAKNSLNITTLKTQNREHYNGNADNYYRLDQSAEVGNVISAKGDIRAVSGDDMVVRQSDISSESGEVLLGSREGDVRIEAGRAEDRLETARKSTSRGIFSKTTSTYRYTHDISEAIGSNIDGRNVNVIAQSGDVWVKGSSMVGDEALGVYGNNVSIMSDVNTHYQDEMSSTKKSGLMGSGFGFTIGSKKEQIEQDRTQQSAARSQVGSLSGNTTIQAGNHYQQTGSIVTSRDGDVDITAKSANITAARSDYESNYKRTTEQKGVTVAVNHPVLSAVKTTEKAMSSLQQAGESKNNRINALSAVNVAWDSFRAIDAGLSALGSIQGNTFSDFGISATYGQQKNISTSQSKGSTMASSEINAGGQVNLSAVGNGEISQINVIGSNIAGHLGTNLLSQGDIKIEAIQQTHQERSNNKSTGFNGGVTVSTGGIGFTAGANYGKGYGNGNEVTYTYSHIGSSNSQTTIHSANDVTLKGGQTVGKGVSLTADNLHIESVQETLDYESKQKNVSGSATVGAGASISGGYDSSKMNAHYKNVVEQSGIYAGDDGYQVNIANHTNLVGSLMQSTDKAESNDKNFFSTGTLEYRDLKNTSNYSAEGYSLNAGVSMEGDFRIPFGNNTSSVSNSTQEAQVQTTAKDDQVIQTIAGMGGTAISQAELEKSDTEKERNTGVKLDGLAGVFNQGNWGVAKALAASTLGVVSRDSNETGVTTSSINTKNIVITKGNEAENNAKIADLNKGNIHQSVAKVDIERVKSDFERDLGVAKEFMENLSAIGDKLYYDVEKNEKNILVKYKPENCRNAAEKCVKVFELNLDTLRNRELRKDEAEILSKMYAHGILNTSDLDRVYGSIQYSGKDVLNNASIVVRKPYAGLAEEMSFTIFERLRAGIDMPSVFGASNASRDQATIWDKLNSYNAKNPYERVSLDHVAHSLGASSTKNAMNWAKYKGVDLNETTLKGYVAGTSYPITNKTIGGRLSFGLYDQGYTEKAASLFKDGKVEYAVAPGDIVGTGIGLPYLPGSWSLGIGNTNTTGDNFPRIPGRILTGDHNVAYYKDEEVIKFFMPDRDKFNEIKNYQEKTWGKIGPKMETLPFRNKEVIKI